VIIDGHEKVSHTALSLSLRLYGLEGGLHPAHELFVASIVLGKDLFRLFVSELACRVTRENFLRLIVGKQFVFHVNF